MLTYSHKLKRNLLHYCRMTKIKALVASCAAVESDVQSYAPLHLVLQSVCQAAEGAAGMSLVPMAALYTSTQLGWTAQCWHI